MEISVKLKRNGLKPCHQVQVNRLLGRISNYAEIFANYERHSFHGLMTYKICKIWSNNASL